MNNANKNKYQLLAFSSVTIGSLSLFLFLFFLLLGPLDIISFQFSTLTALFFNLLLSFLFFLQHSVMIRTKIRKIIEDHIPEHSFYAFYSICSSMVLLIVIIFWQRADTVIFVIETPYRYLIDAAIVCSFLGLTWTALSLAGFDPFGKQQIKNFLENRPLQKPTFIVRGPYTLVRHPFYFFTLVLLWSCPVVTVDRLFFSMTWTTWIIIGAKFEERDLVKKFGNNYAAYQNKVPMLFPSDLFKRKK